LIPIVVAIVAYSLLDRWTPYALVIAAGVAIVFSGRFYWWLGIQEPRKKAARASSDLTESSGIPLRVKM